MSDREAALEAPPTALAAGPAGEVPPARRLSAAAAALLALAGAGLNALGSSQAEASAWGMAAAFVALSARAGRTGVGVAAVVLAGLAPGGLALVGAHALELLLVAGLARPARSVLLAALGTWTLALVVCLAVDALDSWQTAAVVGLVGATVAEAALQAFAGAAPGEFHEPEWAPPLRANLLAVVGPVALLCFLAFLADSDLGLALGALLLSGAGTALNTWLGASRALEDVTGLHDPGTGLPNRRQLETRLRQWTDRGAPPFALLHLGIERLRAVESSFGRPAADVVRAMAARRLEAIARPGDLVARVADDEFVVLLRDAGEREVATRLGIAMVDALGRPFGLPTGEVVVSARVGVGLYPADGATAEVLLRNATAATWAAQRLGRDVVRHYTSTVNSREVRRLSLEAGLRRAIEEDKIELYLQPIVDIRSGRATGAEALVRWPAPDGSFHTPSEFIPLAEESDLILALDAWMLDAAARAIAGLGAAAEGLVVSINLSPRQLQRSGLEARVREGLARHGVLPKGLGVEITEGTALQDFDRTAETLRALRGAGIKVSIDDFGTGYSSLSYLRRLPVDAVKLDASFVREIERGEDAAVIAAAVIAMSHGLRLQVIAEGVENEAQLRYLRAHGCDAVQGYLVSPAVPPGEFAALVATGDRLLPD